MGFQRQTTTALSPDKWPSTHFTGVYLVTTASMDKSGKFCSHWDSIPHRPDLSDSVYRLPDSGPS